MFYATRKVIFGQRVIRAASLIGAVERRDLTVYLHLRCNNGGRGGLKKLIERADLVTYLAAFERGYEQVFVEAARPA